MGNAGNGAAANAAYDRGVEVLEAMWGDEPAAMLGEIETDFNRDIFRQIIGTCFAGPWSDDTLTPRERSLVTVAIVAALAHEDETALHFRWGLKNGCTPAELREVIKHVAAYAGAPAGGKAARIGDAAVAGHEASV